MSFSWSFSRLKNFEGCPKKHYEIDIAKNYTDSGEQLKWGNQVHGVLAKACRGKTPLPAEYSDYQKWVDRVRQIGGKILTEQKYAITKSFLPCEWFDKKAWLRGIADVVITPSETYGVVIDWKTGSVKPDEYRPQLMLMAQTLFSHMPVLQVVRSEFIWLKEKDCSTKAIYNRADMPGHWASFLPQVATYEKAITTQTFPPRPSGLCKRHCPVVSCPYHGKGSF
jgi:PD-(D/E)XK nuclease superfamily